MKIRVLNDLPIVSANIEVAGKYAVFRSALLDTGSFGSLFRIDILAEAGIQITDTAQLSKIYGVGGYENVLTLQIDKLQVGELEITNPFIQTGAMNYGIDIDAIIGFDFFKTSRAVVDFDRFELRVA